MLKQPPQDAGAADKTPSGEPPVADDYTEGGAHAVRIWMAHHQGMSLLSVCNLMSGHPFQRYFHGQPRVTAAELLLSERLPAAMVAEALRRIRIAGGICAVKRGKLAARLPHGCELRLR